MMLKTPGHSTLQLLRDNNGYCSMELAPQQLWRYQTTGPNADHKEPRISNRTKQHRQLEDHLDRTACCTSTATTFTIS